MDVGVWIRYSIVLQSLARNVSGCGAAGRAQYDYFTRRAFVGFMSDALRAGTYPAAAATAANSIAEAAN
jgi:hypothetical protein